MPGALPALAFLLSIVGLSVSLAGFSGLVAALHRHEARRPIDAFRLRQIPEMSLATGFLALITPALADTTGSATTAIRIAGGAGLLFTLVHLLLLRRRAVSAGLRLSRTNWWVAGLIDAAVLLVGAIVISAPTAAAFEWLLALMIARPGLAFVLALADVSAD